MKFNESLISGFIKANIELPEVIKAYEINISSLCRQAKMNRKSFYNKIKNKSFTGDELMRIAKVINK